MRIAELRRIPPALLFAMTPVSPFGPDRLAIGSPSGWCAGPGHPRLSRAELHRIRLLDYVGGSRAVGASDARNIRRVIVPGALPPPIVAATLAVGAAILVEAGPAFLGLGDPDTMRWGLTIGAHRDSRTAGMADRHRAGACGSRERAVRAPRRRRPDRRSRPERARLTIPAGCGAQTRAGAPATQPQPWRGRLLFAATECCARSCGGRLPACSRFMSWLRTHGRSARGPGADHGPVRADARRARRVEHVRGAARGRPRAGRLQPRGGASSPVRRDRRKHRVSGPARAGQKARPGGPSGPGWLRGRDVHHPGYPDHRDRPASRAVACEMPGNGPDGSAPPTRSPLAIERSRAPSPIPLRASPAATGFTLSGASQAISPAPSRSAFDRRIGREGPRSARRMPTTCRETRPARRSMSQATASNARLRSSR